VIRRTSLGVVFIRSGAALIGVATLFSWWASPDRLAGLPWSLITLAGCALVLVVAGPALGILTRRLTPRHILWFFLVATLLALLSALLTSRWPSYKLSWLDQLYRALPSITSLSWGKAGLQPNQTGGFLAVCTAFAATIAASPRTSRRTRWIALGLTIAGTLVVFMTGSRAALAGLAVVYVAILVIRTRRVLWAWACAVVVLVVALTVSGWSSRLLGFFLADEGLNTKLASRLDIWSSALRGIEDHFFTGIGLGVFNHVIPARYPYHVVGLAFPVSQAHNLFLDVTLAIGFPGLVGLALLVAGCFILALEWIRDDNSTAPIALGLLASLVVYLVFGLTDSISLSVPTSFIMWLWAASLVLLHHHRLNHFSDT
jgi:O-antigen ligase